MAGVSPSSGSEQPAPVAAERCVWVSAAGAEGEQEQQRSHCSSPVGAPVVAHSFKTRQLCLQGRWATRLTVGEGRSD